MVANESAATFKWLVGQLGLDRSEAPAHAAWKDVCASMQGVAANGQHILQMVDWISDFWVARGAVPVEVIRTLAPAWMPPEDITQWPAFDVEEVVALFSDRAMPSSHGAFLEMLRATPEAANAEETARDALARYMELKSALVPNVFDIPAVQTEHVRVWLGTSVGHLLMSAALSPQTDIPAIANEVVRRMDLAARMAEQRGMTDDLGDRQLEVLYNARIGVDGAASFGALRTGQGGEWRDHWLSLGFEMGAEDTLEAVRMAAKLLRCPSLVGGLQAALNSGAAPLKGLATAVVRRWLLTLQSMAWLEAALLHSWADVRPRDLCCFALNATKPDWPRHVVAISHRSRDVKPQLRGMQAWRAGKVAIDANYVPSWETNIGMIWGLFAATPAIVRIHSPSYRESVWCRRELELTDYVLKESDFMSKRWIIDLEEPDLGRVDTIVQGWHQVPGPLPEYPPLTEICSPGPMPSWQVRMLRASAALRLVHAVFGGSTPDQVNRLALHLLAGGDVPLPTPTNNSDGWRAYGEVFRGVNEINGVALGELAVSLPNDYDASQREIDLQMAQIVPDLQPGRVALADVLVALEWLRVEYPQYAGRRRGDYLAINCQRLTRQMWESDEEVSLFRGLAALRSRLPVPLWIIQQQGQEAECWPLLGDDVPIFTEHVEAQFGWMLEINFEPRDAQQRYPQDSGMVLAAALLAKCRG